MVKIVCAFEGKIHLKIKKRVPHNIVREKLWQKMVRVVHDVQVKTYQNKIVKMVNIERGNDKINDKTYWFIMRFH